MGKSWQDLRFAIRQMRKAPGFALTIILTIALGIGATTAVFSLVNTVLLRPLPFPEPDRLAAVGSLNDRRVGPSTGPAPMSYPDFFDFRTRNHCFTGIAAYHDNDFTLTGSGEPKHLSGYVVAAEFFDVLGTNPALGRGIGPQDEKPGARVVVLSHRLWQTAFGSANDIIGSVITLDNRSYTVIGLMPQGFEFPIQNPAPVLWTSLADDAYDPMGEPMTASRGAHLLSVIGRLKPGVSMEQAKADLAVIARNLAAQYPDTNRHFVGAVVKPQLDDLVGDIRPALRLLFAAVSLVLLIACANVAGLLLARASRRRSEVAVRSALGASRPQIMRQMLVESLFLALCGGGAGIALSMSLLRMLVHLVPSDLPRSGEVSVDATVLFFATVVSLFTGLLFGVLPAWRISRVDPSTALRDGARTATAGRGQHRVQNALVIAQTAIGLVLLIASGLLIRSFVRVLQVNPGFDRKNVLTASLDLPLSRYSSQQQVNFENQVLERLRALPGVQSASGGWPLPLSAVGMTISFNIEGRPLPPGDRNVSRASLAQPDYFQVMHIPLLRGREFRTSDNSKSNPVVIVSEGFAKKFFPGEDPLGKHITPGLDDGTVKEVSREIIGVVAEVKARSLKAENAPEYYLPFAQAVVFSPKIVVRTAVDPTMLIPAIRAAVAQIDKNVPLYDVRTMDDLFSRAAAQPRFQAVLLSCFAAVALLLSAVGLYGLLSHIVVQRTLEIGLRIALGAPRRNVLGMILRRGLWLAGVGLAIGILCSLAMTRFVSGLLFGVKPFDPLTLMGVSLVLLLVALVASSAPAYRAANLNPMKTLREQ